MFLSNDVYFFIHYFIEFSEEYPPWRNGLPWTAVRQSAFVGNFKSLCRIMRNKNFCSIVLLPRRSQCKICGNLWLSCRSLGLSNCRKVAIISGVLPLAKLHAWITLTPEGCWRFVRKGLEGRGHRRWPSVTARSGGTEPPQSPVFGGAENAPKWDFEKAFYIS
jgi:hypothetical protein